MENEEKRLRMAIIAGAASAIRYKDKNPRKTEAEVIKHISESATEILENIDNPL